MKWGPLIETAVWQRWGKLCPLSLREVFFFFFLFTLCQDGDLLSVRCGGCRRRVLLVVFWWVRLSDWGRESLCSVALSNASSVGPSSVFHFSFYHRVAPFLQDAVLTLNQGGLVGSEIWRVGGVVFFVMNYNIQAKGGIWTNTNKMLWNVSTSFKVSRNNVSQTLIVSYWWNSHLTAFISMQLLAR